MTNQIALSIEPWDQGDLPLLERLLGDPEMTKHLGGPESPEKLAERQSRYERLADSGKSRGIAGTATLQAIALAGSENKNRFLHRFLRSTIRRQTQYAGSSASHW